MLSLLLFDLVQKSTKLRCLGEASQKGRPLVRSAMFCAGSAGMKPTVMVCNVMLSPVNTTHVLCDRYPVSVFIAGTFFLVSLIPSVRQMNLSH